MKPFNTTSHNLNPSRSLNPSWSYSPQSLDKKVKGPSGPKEKKEFKTNPVYENSVTKPVFKPQPKETFQFRSKTERMVSRLNEGLGPGCYNVDAFRQFNGLGSIRLLEGSNYRGT